MEANAGEYIKSYLHLKRFLRISLHCKLVPVQYWEYEYGLFHKISMDYRGTILWQQTAFITLERNDTKVSIRDNYRLNCTVQAISLFRL